MKEKKRRRDEGEEEMKKKWKRWTKSEKISKCRRRKILTTMRSIW